MPLTLSTSSDQDVGITQERRESYITRLNQHAICQIYNWAWQGNVLLWEVQNGASCPKPCSTAAGPWYPSSGW